MQVFIGEKLKKQINNDIKNRKDIIARLDNIVEKVKSYKNQTEIDIKGFKQFRGTKYPVYAFDIGLNKSSSMAGERLIVSFVDLQDKNSEIFKRVVEDDDLKNDNQGILLHIICKHDDQNNVANLISNEYISNQDYIDASTYFTNEEINSINESIELKSKYEKYVDYRYLDPKITVLSLDKYEIIDKFVYDTQPTIVRGIAGSGKTEIIIKAMHDLSKATTNEKILYLTLSLELKDSVQKKCETFEHNNIQFETLKSLYRKYLNTDRNYENFNNFEEFIEYYKNNENKNYQLKNKIINFINNNNTFNIYSEIYGLINGYMLKDWNRTNTYKITLDEYMNTIDDYKMFDQNEQKIIYDIADLYDEYCKNHDLLSYNHDSIDILNMNGKEKYDYIFVDEVQDLTEVQIAAVYSLVKNRNNILLSGDEKQVINPTFFKVGRINQLFLKYEKSLLKTTPLNANFRNSKSVTELINYYNSIRNKYLPALKIENMIEEESKNASSGHVYNYVGDTKELIDKINDSANSAIIVDEKEYKKLEKNNEVDMRTIYTAQKCKGIEFDNVLTLNMLGEKKDLYDDLYEKGKTKDTSLHYNFNLFYVAITRSIYNLVMYEEFETKIFNELINNIDSITKIDDIEELELSYDKDALSFFLVGKKNLEKMDYIRAQKNFEKAKKASNIEDIGINEIDKYINISKIYLLFKTDKDLAQEFEKNGYYDFALKHYEEIRDFKNASMMCLLIPNSINRFKNIIMQEKVNIFDLYTSNGEYNKAIDNYFKSEYRKIIESTETNEILTEIIKDNIEKVVL